MLDNMLLHGGATEEKPRLNCSPVLVWACFYPPWEFLRQVLQGTYIHVIYDFWEKQSHTFQMRNQCTFREKKSSNPRLCEHTCVLFSCMFHDSLLICQYTFPGYSSEVEAQNNMKIGIIQSNSWLLVKMCLKPLHLHLKGFLKTSEDALGWQSGFKHLLYAPDTVFNFRNFIVWRGV